MEIVEILVNLGTCITPTACEYLDLHRSFQADVDELKRRVSDLNGLKDDIESKLEGEDLSKRVVRKQVKNWLENVQKTNVEMQAIEAEERKGSCFHRASLGKRVRQKIKEVEKISQDGLFPQGLVTDKPQRVRIPYLPSKMVGEVDVKEEIWGYLMGHKVGIIGVYGIGGIGKTTIMKHIHDELLIKGGFDKVMWVTVSESTNVVKLQGDIASKMNSSLPKDGDESDRAQKLMDIMKKEKYVLILDDVWDTFFLHEVGIPKPTTENGCKIVITTRSWDVCRNLDCQKIVRVQPLSNQESLNLFLEKVGQDIQKIPELKDIVELIVGECAGLPLAIVVIAASLKGVEDIQEWRNARTKLRECGGGDEIFKCLKYSYDRLSDSVQNCFLYCSLYPEDADISRASVIENWICEGLFEESRSRRSSRRSMHDMGQTILNELERNSLLEKGRSGGHVKLHDAVRNMALLVKKSEFKVKVNKKLRGIQENDWTQDLKKVSLMRDISYIPENMSPKCPMLSTLILENNEKLTEIPECFFANMPLLKLLNLSETGIKVLPNSVCNLERLTALILCGCEHLERMPSLAKFQALQKLDLCKAVLLVVPKGIGRLASLQYLDLCCPRLKELPRRKISSLSCLQYLCRYKLSTEEILRGEAATLKELENFEGGFYDIKAFNCFVSKSQHFLEGLYHYVLAVGGFEIQCFNHCWSFQNCYCVKKVIFVNCKIGGEDNLVLPDDLQVLIVENCSTVSDISAFMNNTTQDRVCGLLIVRHIHE